MEMMKNKILTSYIKQCKLVNDKCTGCQRTLSEIVNWKTISDSDKLLIMNRLKSAK